MGLRSPKNVQPLTPQAFHCAWCAQFAAIVGGIPGATWRRGARGRDARGRPVRVGRGANYVGPDWTPENWSWRDRPAWTAPIRVPRGFHHDLAWVCAEWVRHLCDVAVEELEEELSEHVEGMEPAWVAALASSLVVRHAIGRWRLGAPGDARRDEDPFARDVAYLQRLRRQGLRPPVELREVAAAILGVSVKTFDRHAQGAGSRE